MTAAEYGDLAIRTRQFEHSCGGCSRRAARRVGQACCVPPLRPFRRRPPTSRRPRTYAARRTADATQALLAGPAKRLRIAAPGHGPRCACARTAPPAAPVRAAMSRSYEVRPGRGDLHRRAAAADAGSATAGHALSSLARRPSSSSRRRACAAPCRQHDGAPAPVEVQHEPSIASLSRLQRRRCMSERPRRHCRRVMRRRGPAAPPTSSSVPDLFLSSRRASLSHRIHISSLRCFLISTMR